MKLYSSVFSSNARKVRMVASMLEVPLEIVEVNLAENEQRAPGFLALNPMGRVPVLIDGDFVLAESAAIMAYVADSKPGNSLYPSGHRERADVNRWLFWTASHWGPAFAALAYENWLKGLQNLGAPDPLQVERQANALRGFAQVLDAHLHGRDWVCGDSTTVADLAIATSLAVAPRAKFSVDGLPAVLAWFKRVEQIEAWRATAPPPLPR